MPLAAWRGVDGQNPGRRCRALLKVPDGAVVCSQPRGAEPVAVVKDREAAIQVGVDVDAGAGVAATAGPGVELQHTRAQLERVVVADGALILEAADALEVGQGRGGPPGRVGMRGRLGEARIVAREKPVHDALGLGEGAGLREAEFGDEAILEGAEEPLDPAFALRRRRGDPADAEFLQGAADLRGCDGALELRREAVRRAGVAMKDPMAIGVGGAGDAIAPDEAAEHEKVAMGIFLGAKDGGEDRARGIVDGGMEDEAGPAVLEPGVLTAIHLDEQAGLRHALAAAAMPGRAAGAGTAEAGGPEEPLHRLPRQAQALALRQQLREVVIVRAEVGSAGQGEDPGADDLSDAPRGGPPSVAMGQRTGAVLPQACEQPTEMAQREVQDPGRLPGVQNAVVDARQDMHALVLHLGQGDRLPVHPPRVTDSLTRYGVTESWTYYTISSP